MSHSNEMALESTSSIPSDFKKLMTARFLFTLAVQMQSILLGWQMYVLTHDPLYLGFIGLAEAVPALGLALYAGYLVDRGRPLLINRLLIAVSFLSATLMFLSQRSEFGFSSKQQIIYLFSSSVLTGAARAFSQPATFAIVPRIVKRDYLPKASAWMSMAMQIARISGPAIGGFLYGWLGVAGSSGLVCLTLIGALLALLLMRVDLPALPVSKQHASRKEEFLSGAKFVFKHPILFPALTLDMISVLFGGVTSLLPIFAAQILMVGPTGLGLLRASPAAGAAITSIWLTNFEIRERAGRYLLWAVTGFGVCIIIFSVSQNYYLSLFALFASGAFDSVSMIIRSAAVQLASPEAMRGKISAVNSMFIGSSNELGEFESGVAARLMGTVPSAIFGGVVCLLTVAIVFIVSPTLRRLNLDDLKKPI